MEGITRGNMVIAAKGNEQSSDHNKKPLAFVMAPPEPPSRAGSVLIKAEPYSVTLGDAGDSSSGVTKSYLPFANATIYPAPSGNPSKEKPIPDEQAKLAKLTLRPKFDPNTDPRKLRKLISNRLSAQRSRIKKAQYIFDLEEQVKTFQEKVAALRTQVASYTNQKQLLMLEKKKLDKKLEALEKEKSLKEAETEKSNAELNILREIQMKQLEQQFGAPMFNWNAGPWPISSYPNSDPVAENGGQTTEVKVEMPDEDQIQTHANMDQQTPNMTLPNYPGWTKF